MMKLFFLLASMFLLVGCVESVAVVGSSATNGKVAQSSLQSLASYGIKKTTGETPIGHALNYMKRKNPSEKERTAFNEVKIKEKKLTDGPSKAFTSSLQLSINEKSKIKYLD